MENKATQYHISPDYKMLYYKMRAKGAEGVLYGSWGGFLMAALLYFLSTCNR